MGKIHFSKDLQKRWTSSSLLAVSLAASLAAFGCTTNLNPGNGTPTRSGPELRTAPTSGVTSGSETVTPAPRPMTSSYNSAEVLPAVTPRAVNRGIPRRSAAEAAAIMAGVQPLRGRYLGQVNPGPGNRPYASDSAGGLGNPAMQTNPQMTINSSLTSPAPGSIDSGTVAATNGMTNSGVIGNATTGTVNGTTSAATLAGTTITGTSTTGTGVGLPAGTLAVVRPGTTESISNNPSVTAASVGFGRAGVPLASTTNTTGTAATSTTTSAATTDTTVTAASSLQSASVTGGVRIVRGTTGVTITNSSRGNLQ